MWRAVGERAVVVRGGCARGRGCRTGPVRVRGRGVGDSDLARKRISPTAVDCAARGRAGRQRELRTWTSRRTATQLRTE